MSRIGRQPVKLPSGVSAQIEPTSITVSGPKGTLSQPLLSGIKVEQKDDSLVVSRTGDEAKYKARHGLVRALLSNNVSGVSSGFVKKLELNGVGYRVNLSGNELKFNIGFSHQVSYRIPDGVTVSVDQNIITVSGIDKQQVGQVAAQVRSLKKPEPYKGKGIKYQDERIIRKAGKSGKEK